MRTDNSSTATLHAQLACLALGGLITYFWAWYEWMVLHLSTLHLKHLHHPHNHTRTHSFAITDAHPPFTPIHSPLGPLLVTLSYLITISILKSTLSKASPTTISYLRDLLTPTMIAYNVLQVFINSYIVLSIFSSLRSGHPLVGSTTATTCSFAVWLHYCDKYLEYFDTIFMILRGRFDQVSFLHVYHHATIGIAWYIGVRLMSTGDSYFGALANSIIHVFMYAYYALALMKINCVWKRFLTVGQLVQFVLVVLYTGAVLVVNWQLGQLQRRHVLACFVQVGEMVSLFVLFSLFYNKTYNTNKYNNKYNNKNNNDSKTTEDKDECKEAVVAGVEGVKQQLKQSSPFKRRSFFLG